MRQFTFSEFTDTTFHDWKTADVSEVGVDYSSYLNTYYQITEDTMFWLQSPFVYVFLENSDVWDDTKGLLMRGAFDWSSGVTSHKWSAQEQVYRFRKENLVSVVRKKVRGKGRAIQLLFESEEGKDFNLLGWGLWLDKKMKP